MARFLIWSDLHCEHHDFEIPKPDELESPVDAILVAGDTDVKGRHVDFYEKVWDIWQVPVLAVAGNHEPYGAKRFQKHLEQEREALRVLRNRGADVDVLRSRSRIIGDTRVLGTTLWTDLDLYPDRAKFAHIAIKDAMNDYKEIKWFDAARGIYRKMIPADTKAMHAQELSWLMGELGKPFEGRTLVMTHHIPVIQALSQERLAKAETTDAAYASDLWQKLGWHRIDAWISGHSHDCVEVLLEGAEGDTAFLSNPRGYPFERTRFDPLRVLDSAAPTVGSSITADDEGPSPD